MTAQYGQNKNYNLFINKPLNNSQINASPYVNGSCISNGISNAALAGLTDASTTGFDAAYPDNFANALDAKQACKLWAADTQNYSSSSSSSSNPTETYFAITKNSDNKFKCFTGNALSGTPSQYTVKKTAYSVASSNDATRGGLFLDGTLGVYNHIRPELPPDPSNPYNVKTSFLAPLAGYTTCDKFIGGALNVDSINATLGANCTNTTNLPVNVRYIYIQASPTVRDSYIQISQLAVFGFINGVGQNVASKLVNSNASASCGNGASYTNGYPRGYKGSDPNTAIDGILSSRPWPSIYHSATVLKTEWWKLDLGKNYPIYQIDYYNRADLASWRAQGMLMQLFDNVGSPVTIKDPHTGANVTTFTFRSANAKQSFVITK